MSNNLHENDGASSQNHLDDENNNKNSVVGLDEGTMKMIVIILGVLLLIGFVVVVGTIVYRVVNIESDETSGTNKTAIFEMSGDGQSLAFKNYSITRPKNTQLKSFNVDNGLIYLYFADDAGHEILKIVRLNDGKVMNEIAIIDPILAQ